MSYQSGGSGTFLDYTGDPHATLTVTGLTIPAGSIVVVFLSYDNAGGDLTPTVSDGTRSWTQRANMPGTTIGNQRGHAFEYVNHPGGSGLTITATPSAGNFSYSAMAVWCYDGLATASALDVVTATGNEQPTPGTATDAVTTGSMTTTVANDVLVAFSFATNTVTVSAGTGMTSRLSTAQFRVADKVVASAGSTSATFTINSASAMGTIGLAYKPATGNASVNLTGQSITTSAGTPTVTAVRNPSPSLTGQSISVNRGNVLASPNYGQYQIVAANALTTVDSIFSALSFTPQDGDISYWPNDAVNGTVLVPEISSGSVTGRISTGPLTGSFKSIYYRLSNSTYYDWTVTLVDGAVASITLTGQQIQSSSGASFVRVDISKAVTGQAITSSAGTLTVNAAANVSLVGQSIAVSAGTPSVTTNTAVSIPLTGQSITVSRGTLTASGNASPSLVGQQISVGQGSVTVQASAANATVNLTGMAITSGTSAPRAATNITPYYITYHNVEYVLGNTNR